MMEIKIEAMARKKKTVDIRKTSKGYRYVKGKVESKNYQIEREVIWAIRNFNNAKTREDKTKYVLKIANIITNYPKNNLKFYIDNKEFSRNDFFFKITGWGLDEVKGG